MSGSGGFAHMEPVTVEQESHRFGMRAQELADGWRNHESAITGLEAAIGNDVVGAAFRGAYDPECAAVRESAGAVPALLQGDADAAAVSAVLYTDGDQRSRAGFQGIPPSGPSRA